MPRCPTMPVLLVLLLASTGFSSGETQPELGQAVEESDSARACGVGDLIPPNGEDISDSWDTESLVSPPFDCTCTTLKASYHCPNLGKDGYPKWNPPTVSSGFCEPKDMETLEQAPFPPGFKVLFFGNSHIRQVVQSILCTFPGVIRTRWLTLQGSSSDAMRRPDTVANVDKGKPCRGCLYPSLTSRMLVEDGCVSSEEAEEACSCNSNESAFEFENGAVLHYHFAHREDDKSIDDALKIHGTELWDYDAVFANPGNRPRMQEQKVLREAGALKEAGVPFFWLSAYDGHGDVLGWSSEGQEEFRDSGARFVPIHRMVESLTYLTRGVVEKEGNHHFCLPGPPTEIGILLLRIAWALHDANESSS
eukprot:g13740.t1